MTTIYARNQRNLSFFSTFRWLLTEKQEGVKLWQFGFQRYTFQFLSVLFGGSGGGIEGADGGRMTSPLTFTNTLNFKPMRDDGALVR